MLKKLFPYINQQLARDLPQLKLIWPAIIYWD